MPRPLPDVAPALVVPPVVVPSGAFAFFVETIDVWGYDALDVIVTLSATTGPATDLQLGAECRPLIGAGAWAPVPVQETAAPPPGAYDLPPLRLNAAIAVVPGALVYRVPAMAREMRFGVLVTGGVDLTLSIEVLRRL